MKKIAVIVGLVLLFSFQEHLLFADNNSGRNSAGPKCAVENKKSLPWQKIDQLLEDGQVDQLIKLLSESPSCYNLDQQDQFGETLLVKAAERGHFNLIQLLISQKVDLEVRDANDCTALFYAVSSGNLDIVDLLIAAGAKTNVVNYRKGEGVLFEAVRLGEIDFFKSLVKKYPELFGQKNDSGESLLFEAVRFYQPEMISYLCSMGLDPDEKNIFGQSPRDEATAREFNLAEKAPACANPLGI